MITCHTPTMISVDVYNEEVIYYMETLKLPFEEFEKIGGLFRFLKKVSEKVCNMFGQSKGHLENFPTFIHFGKSKCPFSPTIQLYSFAQI